MIAIRGRYQDQELKLHQYANNWLSCDGPDGPVVMHPTSVVLNPEEVARMRRDQRSDRATTRTFFWSYDVHDDGRITKKRRP